MRKVCKYKLFELGYAQYTKCGANCILVSNDFLQSTTIDITLNINSRG